jgi:hypothetical protein
VTARRQPARRLGRSHGGVPGPAGCIRVAYSTRHFRVLDSRLPTCRIRHVSGLRPGASESRTRLELTARGSSLIPALSHVSRPAHPGRRSRLASCTGPWSAVVSRGQPVTYRSGHKCTGRAVIQVVSVEPWPCTRPWSGRGHVPGRGQAVVRPWPCTRQWSGRGQAVVMYQAVVSSRKGPHGPRCGACA